METYRSILEVLKFSLVRDTLLCFSHISSHWAKSSDSNELWDLYIDLTHLPVNRSLEAPSKSAYRDYMDIRSVLILLRNDTLRLVSVRTLTVRTHKLGTDLGVTDENAYCFVQPLKLIAFGSGFTKTVHQLDLITLTSIQLDPMSVEHSYPGTLRYSQYVYLFGGKTTTCEKYNLKTTHWEPIAAKLKRYNWGLTPTRVDQRVYLVEHSAISVFDLGTEGFSDLSVTPPLDWWFPLVTIWGGELIVVQQSLVGRWRIGAEGGFSVTRTEPLGSGYWSNCPGVWHQGCWFGLHNEVPRVSGVLKFDPGRGVLGQAMGQDRLLA